MGFFSRDKPLACSFCARPRGDVVLLISAPNVQICDDCIALSAAAADESSQDHNVARFHCVMSAIIKSLESVQSDKYVTALSDAALALCVDDAGSRMLFEAAMYRSLWQLADAAFFRILAPSDDDRLNAACVCWHLGEVERGLGYVDAIDIAELDLGDRAIALINRAALVLLTAPPPEELDKTLAHLDEAERCLAVEPRPHAAHLVVTNRAHGLVRKGEPKTAARMLSELIAEGCREPAAFLYLGDAENAIGNEAPARDAWERARDVATAGARIHREAVARLGRPDTPYR